MEIADSNLRTVKEFFKKLSDFYKSGSFFVIFNITEMAHLYIIYIICI